MGDPIRVSDMTPAEAAAALSRAPRLLVPVGTLAPRGPHLPLGCDTIILERLTDDLSARTRIPRAPAIGFGVHAASEEAGPGAAGLTRKTLHRVMNELIAAWETEAKVREVIILTAHASEGHHEALSTIRTTAAVRMIDVLGGVFGDLIDAPDAPLHGGEVDTSLLLLIAPDTVDRTRLPAGLAASAEKGQAILAHLLDRLAAMFP